MTAPNLNPVKGARGRFLAAQERAAQREMVSSPREAKRSRAVQESEPAPSPAHSSPDPVQPPKMCVCHGNRPVHAHGFCMPSYDSLRFTRPPKLPNDVAESRREEAMLTARKVKPASPPKTHAQRASEKVVTDKPEVAEFLAANIVQKGLDYEQGVAAARPDLKPVEVAIVAHQAKQDPSVQKAITETLKKRGLDGDSKDYFVQRLWSWFDSRDAAEERKTLQAARILGKHFIEQQISVEVPQKLPLSDLSAGLDAMGLDAETLKSIAAVPVASEMPSIDEFDEDSDDEEE